jgi:hypothetical protein
VVPRSILLSPLKGVRVFILGQTKKNSGRSFGLWPGRSEKNKDDIVKIFGIFIWTPQSVKLKR